MRDNNTMTRLRHDVSFKMTIVFFLAAYVLTAALFYYEAFPQHAADSYSASTQTDYGPYYSGTSTNTSSNLDAQTSLRAQSSETPAVLGRSYPLENADVSAGDGGTVVVEDISAIISPGTFTADMYMRVDRTLRGIPISADGIWQVSDMWNVRMRDLANDNELTAVHAQKNYILAFPYTQEFLKTDQGVRFDENYLKLVRGDTESGPWTVLTQSVVDTVNKKVSVVTNQGGYYFIGGGEYKPTSKNVTDSASGNQGRGITLKENEIIVTVTPSPTPTLTPTQDKISDGAESADSGNENGIGGATIGSDISEPNMQRQNFFTALSQIIQNFFR